MPRTPVATAAVTPLVIGDASGHAVPVTALLAHQVAATQFEQLPEAVVLLAKQCMLDWMGVTLLGAQEPLVNILVDEVLERGGNGKSALVGRAQRFGLLDAALINGAASHALDYDDATATLGGHITVGVASALFPLAEFLHCDGRTLISAFISGYELAARCGLLVQPDHYARGFHPTATVGTIAAAAASAKLLQLDAGLIETAMGIAATQASGLIASFGTMCKPLHVGRAASDGLQSARLAARGFTGSAAMLERPYGFAHAHSAVLAIDKALAPAPQGFYIHENLFKFHAACGGTHALIEAALRLRHYQGLTSDSIKSVIVRVNPSLARPCNIAEPATGLELKFSMRATVALGLLGLDTSAPALYTDALAHDPALVSLRDKVLIEFDDAMLSMTCEVMVELKDGRQFSEYYDAGQPERDLDVQGRRLLTKFLAVATPVLGSERAQQLAQQVMQLEQIDNIAVLLKMTTTEFKQYPQWRS